MRQKPEAQHASRERIVARKQERRSERIDSVSNEEARRGLKNNKDKIRMRGRGIRRDEKIITMFLGKCEPRSEELGRRIVVEGCIASGEGNYVDWGSMSDNVLRS